MFWSRMLIDGLLMSTAATALIFASLRANPRIWLNDFPPDLRRAVPPKSEAEKRQSLRWGLPFLAVLLGGWGSASGDVDGNGRDDLVVLLAGLRPNLLGSAGFTSMVASDLKRYADIKNRAHMQVD